MGPDKVAKECLRSMDRLPDYTSAQLFRKILILIRCIALSLVLNWKKSKKMQNEINYLKKRLDSMEVK